MATEDESYPGREETVPTAAEDVRQTVASGAKAVQHRAKARAEMLSTGVGERAEHIAEALRSAGETLRGREDWLAEAMDGLGRNLSSFSSSARERGFDGLRRDVERLARQRPGMFIGASVAAGLALGRLLRSSPPGPEASEEYQPGSHRATYEGSTGTGESTRGAASSPAYASAPPDGGRYYGADPGRQGTAGSPAYQSTQNEGGPYGSE